MTPHLRNKNIKSRQQRHKEEVNTNEARNSDIPDRRKKDINEKNKEKEKE